MLFWFLIAVLTAVSVLAVLLPLSGGRKRDLSAPDAGADTDVYRQQLAELADDEAQGRIGTADVKAARAEVARRLIAAEQSADSGAGHETGDNRRRRRFAAVIGLVAVPAFALSVYFVIGAPNLPGQPLAARTAELSEINSIEELVARVERHLDIEPEDGRGWELLAPVYMRLGRPDEAATAWRNAIRLLGSTAAYQADLGEALVSVDGGIVTVEARKAFEAALQHNPTMPKARFFLALAKQQDGDAAGAAAAWRALLADTPPDATYRRSIELALESIQAESGDPSLSQADPATDDAANAQSMSPEEQQAMIDTMVSRLADRLASQPDDVEGWLRLVRSYVVLGRQEEARQAAATGMSRVSTAADRERIASLAAQLGIAREGSGQP